jgi:hypothetical protein
MYCNLITITISELKIYNANLRRGRRIKQVLF